jgi:hypothetical protein
VADPQGSHDLRGVERTGQVFWLRVGFEFWTASTFDPDVEACLQEAKETTQRYRIG